ncbi:MAG: hypothetical protein ACJ766_04110 [Thermoleophilaceae bacterium]
MARPGSGLRLGVTLREVARTYGEQWRFLIPTAVLLFLPLGLLEAAADRVHDADVSHLDLLTGVFLSGAALLQFIASALGDTFYTGVVASSVSASRAHGRRHGIVEIARTVPYARLMAVDVVVTLGTAIGLLAFFLPGLVFYTWFALAAPLIEIERMDMLPALRRSRQLVRGSFFKVLVLLTVSELASDALTTAAHDGAIWSVGKSFLGDWAAATASSVLVTPLIAVAAVVVTFELIELDRVRQLRPAPAPRA